MKRLVAALALFAALGAARPAQAIEGRPVAYSEVTAGAAAAGLPSTICDVPAGAPTFGQITGALIQVKTAAIFYLFHDAAGTPSSTSYKGAIGDVIEVEHPFLFRHIRDGAVDAKLAVTCFKK